MINLFEQLKNLSNIFFLTYLVRLYYRFYLCKVAFLANLHARTVGGGRWVRTTPLFVQTALFDLVIKEIFVINLPLQEPARLVLNGIRTIHDNFRLFWRAKMEIFSSSPNHGRRPFITAFFLRKRPLLKSFTVRAWSRTLKFKNFLLRH